MCPQEPLSLTPGHPKNPTLCPRVLSKSSWSCGSPGAAPIPWAVPGHFPLLMGMEILSAGSWWERGKGLLSVHHLPWINPWKGSSGECSTFSSLPVCAEVSQGESSSSQQWQPWIKAARAAGELQSRYLQLTTHCTLALWWFFFFFSSLINSLR